MDWKTIPSLAALRAFDAFARHGSFSAAARELNVTHAAIAQHVRALEAHFGEALAERQGQTMCLTATGRELAQALGEGFDIIADGVGRIADRNAQRPIMVTLTPTFAETWLMPRIGSFWAAHPDIEVRLAPSVELVDLRRDGIDLAIRFGQGNWPGHEVEPLAVNSFVVVAAPGYAKARSLDDLGRLNRLDWFFATASNEQRVWGRALGIDYASLGAQELANNSMVLSAVRAGLGVSIQAQALVESDIASGQLTSIHEGDPEGLGYYIVTRPGVLAPGAAAFRRWLKKTARAQPQT
jgi:LysR family glycine cleavage system transcriptional activator